jgi:undecaprenyl-diphosphatase
MGERAGRWLRAGFLALAAGTVWPHAGAVDLFKLDTFDEREDKGIFSRSNQKRLDNLAIVGVIGLSLFEGTEARLGRASWQAFDAGVTTAVATEVMKRAFSRPRPAQNPDPGVWFAGSGSRSFPSGEVAMMAAFTTPYILAYKDEYPAVWALAALPVYMGKARMASQGHWLTDVMAGGAVGAGMGYLAAHRETPLLLSVTGRSVFVGLHYRF